MRLLGPVKIDLTKVDVPKKVQPELLLHFPIPVALHGLNPRHLLGKRWWNKTRHLLGKRWWNKTRRAAYRSNGGFCQACGASGKLDAHERYEFNFTGLVAKYIDAVPLCRECHQYIHWLSCPIHKKKGVLIRGNKILWEANLRVPAIKARSSNVSKQYEEVHCFCQYTPEVLDGIWSYDWKLDLSRSLSP